MNANEPVAWRVKDRHGLDLYVTDQRMADFYSVHGEPEPLVLQSDLAAAQARVTELEEAMVPDVFDSLLYARESANTSDIEAGYTSLLRRLSGYDMQLIRDAMRANTRPPREGTKSLADFVSGGAQ